MPDVTKQCSTCSLTKSATEYNRHSRTKDGLQPECRECSRRGNAAWREAHPGHNASAKRFRKYGVTPERFDSLLAEQANLCAICECVMEIPALDHSHSTGEVRGVLCRPCNLGLGLFEDDTKRLLAAVAYLNKEPVRS